MNRGLRERFGLEWKSSVIQFLGRILESRYSIFAARKTRSLSTRQSVQVMDFNWGSTHRNSRVMNLYLSGGINAMHLSISSSIHSSPYIYSVSNCFLASAMTFCKYNNSSTRPNFFGSFLNAILKSSTFNLCRGAAILAASRHCLHQRCLEGEVGGVTISLMYSVTMSSRTVTDSGVGFGSSPNAYINSFTSVSWMRRDLYNLFERDSVCVRCGDGDHVPPCLWS